MALLRGSTGTWKQAWKRDWQVVTSIVTELTTSLLFFLEFAQPSFKEELGYGTTLRLPGDVFSASAIEEPSSFVSKLRFSMQHIQFVCTRWHGSRDFYLASNLYTATPMYVWHDRYRPPLTRPYDGPFWVLRHFDKRFTLDINDNTKEITVDRLKPAKLIRHHVPIELPVALSTPQLSALPDLREDTIHTPNQVPSHPPTTIRVGRPGLRLAHRSDYLPTGRGYCGDPQHSFNDSSRTFLRWIKATGLGLT